VARQHYHQHFGFLELENLEFVSSLASFGSHMIIGGKFQKSSNVTADNYSNIVLTAIDKRTFVPLSEVGLNGPVYSISIDQNGGISYLTRRKLAWLIDFPSFSILHSVLSSLFSFPRSPFPPLSSFIKKQRLLCGGRVLFNLVIKSNPCWSSALFP